MTPRLTYAIAPPNQTTPLERRRQIAAAQSARIALLPIDALLVYDVQDEASRNARPRPFPFVPKVDPLSYAFDTLDLGGLPRVVYRAVAGQDEVALCRWLDRLHARGGSAVLVGAPSAGATASMTLPQALSLSRRRLPGLALGGVVIPERHRGPGTEEARVWAKAQAGCGFFVSQTVWSVAAAKRFLLALSRRAALEQAEAPPLLLTFSPCGSPQTLDFLQWLGVEIAPAARRELLAAPDMLARSVDLAADAFEELQAFAGELGLRVGCNVEAVTSRAAEVDAAVELLHRVHRLERVQQAA